MANAKKIEKTIVAYILLVIGLTMFIWSCFYFPFAGSYRLLVGPLIIGVILFVIGLVLRIRSGEKNEHKREISN